MNTLLHQQFEMEDLGLLRYFLDTKFAYGLSSYLLPQKKYILNLPTLSHK